MSYKEEEILKKLRGWEAEVDKEEIWINVKHAIPAKKKRRPVLFFFLGIVALGALSFSGHFIFKEVLASGNSDFGKKSNFSDSNLSQINEPSTNDKMKTKVDLSTGINYNGMNISARPEYNKHGKNKFIESTLSNNSTALTNENREEDLYVYNQQIEFSPSISRRIVLLESNKQKETLPEVAMTKAEISKKVVSKYQDFESGFGYSIPLFVEVNTSEPTYVGKYLHGRVQWLRWQYIHKISNRFSYGMSLQLLKMATAVEYKIKHTEKIGIVDTTQIIIDPSGKLIPVIGNTEAIVITEKQGTNYLSDYKLTIMPTVSCSWPISKNWSLSQNLGLGTDVLQINDRLPSYLITQNESSPNRKSGIILCPQLFLSQRVSCNLNKFTEAYLQFSVLYRTENFAIPGLPGAHDVVIPAVGLGLTVRRS